MLSRRTALLLGASALVTGCSTMSSIMDDRSPMSPNADANPTNNQIEVQPLQNIGQGNIRVGLILSLSGSGNAGAAAQSMRNAAELALAEFANPNIQLMVKDDGGTAQGAQNAAQAAISEGAEIMLGPLFSHAVASAGQITRNRSVPMIAFSTDTNVAARGIYLLSFQPENDVDRVISYAAARGKKSMIAFVPDNAYGNVVEGAIKQYGSQYKINVITLQRYPNSVSEMQAAARRASTSARMADMFLIGDGAEATSTIVAALNASGVNTKRVQMLGTGLWDDQNVFTNRDLEGAWFAAPATEGFRGFAQRYQARYGNAPARTASLAYDAVSLVAQLVKTQGPNRFSEDVLTSRSGFAGVDGVFRFRNDGTCERSLSIMEIRGGGARTVQAAPPNFNTSAAL
ncbi:MAG TPA: penicillin-binding protein activator [Xanthobacteraceae bacterium]|nr:penicillin-binding protein activator [Xanthobacteraceae bacterium]